MDFPCVISTSTHHDYVLAIQMLKIPQATFTNKHFYNFGNWNQWLPYLDTQEQVLHYFGTESISDLPKTKAKPQMTSAVWL